MNEKTANSGSETTAERFLQATFPIESFVDAVPSGYRNVAGSAELGRFELAARVLAFSESAFFNLYSGERGRINQGFSRDYSTLKDSLSSYSGLRFRDETPGADGETEVLLRRFIFADNWMLMSQWTGPKSKEKTGKKFVESMRLAKSPPDFRIGLLSDPADRKKMFEQAHAVWQSQEADPRSGNIETFCFEHSMIRCQFDFLIKEGLDEKWSVSSPGQ